MDANTAAKAAVAATNKWLILMDNQVLGLNTTGTVTAGEENTFTVPAKV